MISSRIKSAYAWSLAVILIDQATKILSRHHLMDGIPRSLLGETLNLTLRYNHGAAFSLSWGGPVFLTVFTSLACLLLMRYMHRHCESREIVWLGVILGGALGNLIDRILMGKVTDFLDAGIGHYRWPTFNVADMAICIGGIAVFLVMRKTRRLEVSSEETA